MERMDEYKGKGKLDIVLIYGCYGPILDQVCCFKSVVFLALTLLSFGVLNNIVYSDLNECLYLFSRYFVLIRPQEVE